MPRRVGVPPRAAIVIVGEFGDRAKPEQNKRSAG